MRIGIGGCPKSTYVNALFTHPRLGSLLCFAYIDVARSEGNELSAFVVERIKARHLSVLYSRGNISGAVAIAFRCR